MAARLPRRAKPSGGRTQPGSAFTAPAAPQRPLRSGFSLALAPQFPGSQRAQTQPGPSRPRSRPFPPCAGGPWGSRCSLGRRAGPGSGRTELHRCGTAHERCFWLALASRRPSRVRDACGEGKLVCAHRAPQWCQHSQHLNVLLVPSWHSLLPDRFLQSKHFGAKQLSSLTCSPDAPTDVSKKNRRAWKSG